MMMMFKKMIMAHHIVDNDTLKTIMIIMIIMSMKMKTMMRMRMPYLYKALHSS